MNTSRSWRFAAAAAVGISLSLSAFPSRAAAQERTVDPRWYAWIGCWQPVTDETTATVGGMPAVCVTPAAQGAGVEISTISAGRVVQREVVDANGVATRADRENCTGTTTAHWSADGQRVFRRSDYTCPGGLERRQEGVMALSPAGEWLDVQALSAGGEGGVRVLRYRPVDRVEGAPSAVETALEGHGLSASTARLAASGMITTEDVVEASSRLGGPTVEAWLIERGQGFALELSGERLLELARAGVPERVIDMVVALSYPDRFAINRASGAAEVREEEALAGQQPRRGVWDSWDYPGYGGYGGYGYGGGYYGGGYGYGYGRGYGRYYDRPVIIVRGSDADQGEGASAARGRAVKGRGYTRGGSSDGRSTSQPSSRPSTSSGSSGSSGSPASSGSSDSGSGSSSGTGRTAKPR